MWGSKWSKTVPGVGCIRASAILCLSGYIGLFKEILNINRQTSSDYERTILIILILENTQK